MKEINTIILGFTLCLENSTVRHLISVVMYGGDECYSSCVVIYFYYSVYLMHMKQIQFFRNQGEEMHYAWGVGLANDVGYPLKPPSFQATRLYPGKAKIYDPKALSETMLPMRRKKSLIISHTQHRTPPIPSPISSKKKELGHPNWEQENVNKGKKQE